DAGQNPCDWILPCDTLPLSKPTLMNFLSLPHFSHFVEFRGLLNDWRSPPIPEAPATLEPSGSDSSGSSSPGPRISSTSARVIPGLILSRFALFTFLFVFPHAPTVRHSAAQSTPSNRRSTCNFMGRPSQDEADAVPAGALFECPLLNKPRPSSGSRWRGTALRPRPPPPGTSPTAAPPPPPPPPTTPGSTSPFLRA